MEQVNDFVYLGAIITKDVSCDEDIQNKISIASAIVGKLGRLWRDKNISLTTKVRLRESNVLSMFLYGSDCWTVKKEQEGKMLSAEMSWFR